MIRSYTTPCGKWQFIPIEKNGSTSIIAAMFGLEGTPEEIHVAKPQTSQWNPSGPPTFAVLRDPMERFCSTWWNKVYKPHRPDTKLIRETPCYAGMPLSEFVDQAEEIVARDMDAHLRPQTSFIPSDAGGQLLRLGRLKEDWDRFELPRAYFPASRLNASQERPPWYDAMTDEEASKIMNIYWKDQVLWDVIR